MTGIGAIVLTGGTGRRLGGVDKATVRLAGRTLLDRVLDATSGLAPVVVLGDPAPAGGRSVRFVREDPPGGGPAAALLAGLDACGTDRVVVLAVDMPHLAAQTVGRLTQAAVGRDGAVLVGHDGRRQLAMVLDADAVRRAAPTGPATGLPLHRLLGGLDLAEVPAVGDEAADVDTPEDLAALAASAIGVEQVGEADWERWAGLRLAALADAPQAFGSTHSDWADAGEEGWRSRMRIPGAAFWIARVAGEDVGMIGLRSHIHGRSLLSSMWVAPAARGRGASDALLAAVAAEVRHRGGDRVLLHVKETNRRARAAYERLGFAATGEWAEPGARSDREPAERELVMELLV